MPDATQSTPRSLAEQALANLVDQFARPLDFLRELVQNSIDAGSPRIDVWVDHDAGSDDMGVLSICVEDHGCGMDEATIDEQLLALYASTKEGDLTKIGKFGIGFTSVFALRPERVLVRTGRHGTWWELVAGPDRVFQKHRSAEPISGTQVLLLKRLPNHDVPAMVEDIRSVLSYWCEHTAVPITFDDRRATQDDAPNQTLDPFAAVAEHSSLPTINRPMTLDAVWLRHTTRIDTPTIGPVDVVLGYAPNPSWGFYNGGITLLRTRDPDVLGDHAARFTHVAFKVRSDRLEHTLTRDNVRRDEAWRHTLDAVAQAHVELRAALLDHVHAQALRTDDLSLGHDALCQEAMADPTFRSKAQAAPILRDVQGRACSFVEADASGQVLVGAPGHPLAQPLAAQGIRIVEDRPATRRLLEILHGGWLKRYKDPTPVQHVEDTWQQATVLDPTQLTLVEQRLVERTRTLLGHAFAGPFRSQAPAEQVQLHVARFVRAPSPDGASRPSATPLSRVGPTDGRLFQARDVGRWWEGPAWLRQHTLLLDRDHAAYQLHRTSAHHDVELAAVGLAHAVMWDQGFADETSSSAAFQRLIDACATERP